MVAENEDQVLRKETIVSLTVSTDGEESRLPKIIDVLGRALAGLALDEIHGHVSTSTVTAYVVEEEVDDLP